ncbi:acyl homoserine lactone synthase [Janthinobacterium sp. CG_23.3]|uniref:acyl-homoserine-lactone synthase n=1 Tax=unclassified Janthinobacterium TaxID=2610881 RepID=UPI0003658A68|nr:MULTISPECIES: acyl-homoserine-lactone synthase [unclassified Janthinobacterium]MEC5160174.1 acyl homoserine lactone synthase [Janthinobacterium sp. CG_S6]
MNIVAVKRGSLFLSISDERNMYRLRHSMFRERLGWDVHTQDGMEFDEYDQLNPMYMMAKEGGTLHGCWRMLPTTGPNMLRDVFSMLLDGEAPCGEDIWELSRFAVLKQDSTAFGLSTLPIQMMLHVVRLARKYGVNHLVTVTTPAMERMLKHANITPRRLGPVVQMGVARAVALWIDANHATESALMNAIAQREELRVVPARRPDMSITIYD